MKFIVTYAGLPLHLHTNACGFHYSAVGQESQASRYDSAFEANEKADKHGVPARNRQIVPFVED